MTPGGRRAVFLDRDGTINEPEPAPGFVTDASGLHLVPGAAEAIRLLNDGGWWVGVVTNQRGVALGLMTTADLDEVHEELTAQLQAAGAHLDGIYACVHDRAVCSCRKPDVGLVLRAIRDHPEIDLASSWAVGDSPRDIEMARRLGIGAIQVTGAEPEPGVEHAAPTLLAAAHWLVAHRPGVSV